MSVLTFESEHKNEQVSTMDVLLQRVEHSTLRLLDKVFEYSKQTVPHPCMQLAPQY